MDIELVLSIIGFFGVVALGINEYFLRGIFQDLNDVKVQLASITARGDAKEERIKKIEENEKEIFERLNKIERGI